MGSSKNPYERLMKLMSSALKLVAEGSRSAESLADHLQIFVFGQFRKVLVKYDDPIYSRIDRDQYVFVADGLRPEHFPVRGKGQTEVTHQYLKYDHEPTTEEVLSTVEGRSDIRLPDFAETMAYHKANPEERMKAPVISLCGTVESGDGERGVAYVLASGLGLNLDWDWVSLRWDQRCRFLVVCK
ncbi:hypothetical protein KJ733_06480 [Patescibacteria group bacterium]|nr:hypothetical protein [Patescibacteria group bacterium]